MIIATSLAAKLTNRPVRCHLTRFYFLCAFFPKFFSVRDEDIRLMGQRGEFRGEYRLGVTAGQFKEVIHSTSVLVFNYIALAEIFFKEFKKDM